MKYIKCHKCTDNEKRANACSCGEAIEPAGTTCYLVIWKDRYSDTTAHPFSNKDKAITEARRIAKEYCKYHEDYKENHIDGWLFYAQYSCEGDHVMVVEAIMDNDIQRSNSAARQG